MTDEPKDYEGFIDTDVDTEDIHEPQCQPTGAYDLTVTSAKAIFAEKEDGTGRYLKKVMVMIDFDDVKNAATLFHNITLWNKDEDQKKRDFKIVLAKKFYKLFSVPFPVRGLNTTDLIGAKATGAFVDLTEYTKVDVETGVSKPPKPSNQLNLTGIKV